MMTGEGLSQPMSPYTSEELANTASLTAPQPNTTVCTVTGLIDADTKAILRDALAKACGDDNAHLVINLSPVTSMDSTGLYALLEARHKHDIGGGGHLAIVIDTNSEAIPELYIIGLQAAFEVHDDRAAALHVCAIASTAGVRHTMTRAGKG
ncbi:MAG TPA: STAS domain-containing protein [Pseudonocardiaceae bacterium]|jgi:anti-anti-sigma factor